MADGFNIIYEVREKNHLLMGEGSWWVEWLENRRGHELGVVNSEAGSL